ncbi:hypothetical protein [Symbioplanes lichenis]|uniref:hypothetical protein n=1 Tax=Symbioplanes lichenis TaxID=1629072 RepID=UPI00273A55E3|nr:hypothetical protein [Actinoplanes lichenis]
MTYPDYELDLEAPEGDAAEQATDAAPGWLAGDDSVEDAEVSPAIEVSEWDAHEQGRVVELEDDYR